MTISVVVLTVQVNLTDEAPPPTEPSWPRTVAGCLCRPRCLAARSVALPTASQADLDPALRNQAKTRRLLNTTSRDHTFSAARRRLGFVIWAFRGVQPSRG
jgi:hypothetical protein